MLVDRLRPRGPAEVAAHVAERPERLPAPTGPRGWFHGVSWAEFRGRYEAEPDGPGAAAPPDGPRTPLRRGLVSPPTATRTPEHGHARVLLELLGRGQPVCRAACRPAARPENRQPPRKVPSSEL
ncbi:hypothetical protein Shyhy01_37800 [Streptomyces hygroscopicus subsp. hygroscopicus]|nr:hypothetical protein Shyhy01_37800 [Streptomyces hygroscopicus subsp. hygroscopicus]